MKKMKLVSCLMAMVMAATVASSVVSAADGTVQITVGNDTQLPGAAFSVDVNMASVPAAGLSSIDFAIDYDATVIDVADVTLGAIGETGAASIEGAELGETLFTWYDTGSQIVLTWATGLLDTSYWVNTDGVFVTISGTVDSTASAGASTALTVSAPDRETYPGSGVASTVVLAGVGESSTASYDYTATAGSVTVGGAATAASWGDVDCNGVVDISDVILLNRFVAEDTAVTITTQGLLNADCVYNEKPDGEDSAAILQYIAGLLGYEDLGPQ